MDHGLKLFLPDADQDKERSLLELPSLVVQGDQGSDVVAPMWFCLHHLQLRLVYLPDVRHQLVRVMANSCKAAKLQAQVALSEILLTVMQGPWTDHKWFQVIREQTEDYLKVAELDGHPCHALLRKLMPAIGREQRLERWDVNAEIIHEALAGATFLKKKGVNNSSRWDAFHSGFKGRKSEWTLLLLILLTYGLKLGYVTSETLNDLTPVVKTASKSTEAEDQPLRNAKSEKTALYTKCRNKMHVATVCLANGPLMRDLHLWFWASCPVRNALNRCRTDMKGRADTLRHLQSLAIGEGLHIVSELAGVCHNQEALHDVGILQQDDVVGIVRFARDGLDSLEVLVQDEIMEKLVWTALGLMHHMMFDLCHHMFGWPLRFAALLDGNHKATCLQEMKETWEAWEAAQVMPGQSWKALCKRNPLRITFCKDVFVRVQRDGWTVSADTRRYLTEILSVFGSTYNEEAFSELRQLEEKDNKKHRMNNSDVWASASEGRVMARFGYREVESDPTVLAPDLPEGVFHTRSKSASVPQIREITGRATWPSLKPLDAARIPAEVQSMQMMHKKKRMQDVSMTWRTSFLTRGMIVRHVSKKKEYKLCTGVWPHGASTCLLPMERYELKKGTYGFRLQAPLTRDNLSWAQVYNFADYEAINARVVSPLHFAHVTSSRGLLKVPVGEGPWIEEDKAGIPLLEHCARNGFFDIPAKFLEILLEASCQWNKNLVET